MPAKRPPSEGDGPSPIPAKHSRTDLNADYESGGGGGGAGGSSRKKNSIPSRTGQACDRCKIRKIRCDARQGGCSPCLQNNTECRTTDRITGLARSRGHTENVENENNTLKKHIANLQQQLRDQGLEPAQPPAGPYGYPPVFNQPNYQAQGQGQGQIGGSWGSLQQSDNLQSEGQSGLQKTLLSDFRTGCIGDNYLGVSSGNSWLSPIEGTSLSLFGAKLDLAEFLPPDTGESGTSYQTFLNRAFGQQQSVPAPQLPPWEQGKVYAQWYFRSITPFVPILHKPDFMRLLTRVYHEGYQTTPAETVMVHMVMAMLDFQYTARNADSQSRNENYDHWFYSLSFVPQLIKGHTLEDMQALTLICAHLRNFPRPGAAWMFINTVIGLAIELGLHRSVTAWQGQIAERNPHTIEMRKRIFWTLLILHITISGKLGRPMPLRMEDFDIEIPEPFHDNLPEESHLDEWKKCSWRAGSYGFKMTKVMMRMYSSIYSVRTSTGSYESNVKQLEKELSDVIASFPPELSGGPQTKDEDRVSALYLESGAQGCRLLIHHPALCRSASPQVMSDNIDACLDASSKMLSVASQLKMLKSLDTTLYYNMDYLAAMFTTLFAYTERRDSMTSADLQHLRQDMNLWVDIMGDVGNLLGTGSHLQTAISNIVEWSLGNINRHLIAKTASAAVASSEPSQQETPQPQQPQPQRQGSVYGNERTGSAYGNSYSNGSGAHELPLHTYHMQPQPMAPVETATYANPPAYSYDPQNMGYNSGPAFDQYAEEDVKPNIEAQLASQAALQTQAHVPQPAPANNFLNAFHSPTAGVYPAAQVPGPVAWREFAENMATGMHMGAGDAGMGAQDGGMMHFNMPMGMPGNTVTGVIKNGMGVPASGAAMGYAGPAASFGEMQMPVQDGSGVPDWPLIHYGSGQ